MSNNKVELYLKSNLSKLPNINESVIKDFIETIRPLITNHTDLLKVDKWYRERNINFKSNPIKYLKDYFVKDLKNGVFERIEKHFGTTSIMNAFRENKIEIKPNADIYLYTMLDFLYNEGYLTEAELVECCKRAINVLTNKGKTTDDFFDLFKKSKVSEKRKFNWEALEKEVNKNIKSWEKIYKELGINDERTIDHIKQYRQH